MALFWHRRDLRVIDNVGLVEAASESPVLPVFVLDTELLEHASSNRVVYLLGALEELREHYRQRGGDLLVRRGDPVEVLTELAREYAVDSVHWNIDYSRLARERDKRVANALEDEGVRTEGHADLLLQPPGTVTTNKDTPYQVFSPFYRSWSDHSQPEPVGVPDEVGGKGDTPVPSLGDLGFDQPIAELQPAGTSVAQSRLEQFCAGPIYDYADDRDNPASANTSRLSADLRFGTVGIRAVWAATQDAAETAPDDAAAASVEEFQRQLAWREFYIDKLAHEPSMLTENHADFEVPIPWRNNEEEITAWKRGKTGYPFVDAGMRQLLAEGWMHNRLRMVTAAFLTKDLLADWRVGYDWFREHLVDHDPANDAGGWQWAASTGWDAQPYFRVFNPTTQGERHDPEARYIKRYVHELQSVAPALIHEWPELAAEERRAAAPEYPDPIVDHAERREAAIAAFEQARGTDDA